MFFASWVGLAALPWVSGTASTAYARGRFFSYDLVHRLQASLTKRGLLTRPPADAVAIVGVDEKALRAVGRWPWDRAVVGELVRAISEMGASAIGLDVLLKEPGRGPLQDLRQILDSRAERPPELERLREQLGAVTREHADRIEADWLLDPEGSDGYLAQVMADSQKVVAGSALRFAGSRDAEAGWIGDGRVETVPVEVRDFLLRRFPETAPARVADQWKKGFGLRRFFVDGGAFPLVEIGGIGGVSRQEFDARMGIRAQSHLKRVRIQRDEPVSDLLLPRGLFIAASRGVGFMNDESAVDGVARAMPVVRSLAHYPMPSLALATLNVAQESVSRAWLTEELQLEELRVLTKEGEILRRVPMDAQGIIWTNPYPVGPAPGEPPVTYPHLKTVSAADVLAAYRGGEGRAAMTRLLDGRAVFIGATALGLSDIRHNSLGRLPGTDNHATAFLNLANGDELHYAWRDTFMAMALSLFWLLLLAFALPRLRPSLAAVTVVAISAGAFVAALASFRLGRVMLPLDQITPVLIYFVAGTLYLNRFENQDKAWIDQMFKRYVSPEYVEELKRNKGQLALTGQEAEITAFFSDLAGFSTFSERFSAERLFVFLGEYLGEMTKILDKHGGTLDKFEGDAVVAFFGAPIPAEDHAVRACEASLDMLERLEELNEAWKAGDIYPELSELAREVGHWKPVKVRIGLNTGVCAIGHLGTAERGNYTMMGDNVNLAARLEGTCKLYDVSMCISESTYMAIRDRITAREIDLIRVMGKTVPTRIYDVLGRAGDVDDKTSEFLFKYTVALEDYKSRNYQAALDRFESAKGLKPWDWVTQLYIDRCKKFLVEPPPADWDGVTDMMSK